MLDPNEEETLANLALAELLLYYPMWLEEMQVENSVTSRIAYFKVVLETVTDDPISDVNAQERLVSKLTVLLETEYVKLKLRQSEGPNN